MLFVDGDADADGGSGDVAAASAAGGRSGRRDCNIGQRLHSCFKLDLLKSFRRTTPTGANWDGKYIFYHTVVHVLLSFRMLVTCRNNFAHAYTCMWMILLSYDYPCGSI